MDVRHVPGQCQHAADGAGFEVADIDGIRAGVIVRAAGEGIAHEVARLLAVGERHAEKDIADVVGIDDEISGQRGAVDPVVDVVTGE